MTYKTWILRSDLGARGTTDAFIRPEEETQQPPSSSTTQNVSGKPIWFTGARNKQTNKKKEVEEKLDQKGMYKWHIL